MEQNEDSNANAFCHYRRRSFVSSINSVSFVPICFRSNVIIAPNTAQRNAPDDQMLLLIKQSIAKTLSSSAMQSYNITAKPKKKPPITNTIPMPCPYSITAGMNRDALTLPAAPSPVCPVPCPANPL
jgi:hypothetical protein